MAAKHRKVSSQLDVKGLTIDVQDFDILQVIKVKLAQQHDEEQASAANTPLSRSPKRQCPSTP